jgi:hypothetical protein
MLSIQMSRFFAFCLMIFSVLFFLSGCQPQTMDKKYLLEHPEKIKAQLVECQKLSLERQAISCKMIFEAANQVRSTLILAIQNREAFGEKVLVLQMEMAKLQAKITSDHQDLSQKQLEQELNEKESQLKQHLAILKIIGI